MGSLKSTITYPAQNKLVNLGSYLGNVRQNQFAWP